MPPSWHGEERRHLPPLYSQTPIIKMYVTSCDATDEYHVSIALEYVAWVARPRKFVPMVDYSRFDHLDSDDEDDKPPPRAVLSPDASRAAASVAAAAAASGTSRSPQSAEVPAFILSVCRGI